MNHRAAFCLLLFLVLSQAFTPLSGNEADDQPHMRAAIRHLEEAKTAEHPIPSLQSARRELVHSVPNKQGQRKDAIRYVDEAIALAEKDDKANKAKMLEKIGKAIANVKSGIARSR